MTNPPVQIRDAAEAEIAGLARLWYDGWQDAHRAILPAELARLRTLESFAERLGAALRTVRVAAGSGQPAGFAMTKGAELYQLIVSAEARGTGVAAALLEDAEARIAEAGVAVAWLACAIGNDRAARFYEKHGWRRAGTMINELETPQGIFPLEVWRYEKRLRRSRMPGESRVGDSHQGPR
jgi:ribosomal protein S18 acetylase RimI-like enzyme